MTHTPYEPQEFDENTPSGDDYFKYLRIEYIKVPEPDDMTYRELAIYMKGYSQGKIDEGQRLKDDITRKFQLTLFGHVL